MLRLLLVLSLVSVWLAAPLTPPVAAQNAAPCGVVEALDYPIATMADEIARGWDDFGAFRSRYGGNHLGLDVAFHQPGLPVMAAAHGRVTYADPEGWDTEKGVVIIEHTFPDGRLYYTLYGHVEETDVARFPAVGACVRRGDVIGTVGSPSRSAPHLHYEIRRVLPNDGGPGYVSVSPLNLGWYHPLDFTAQWGIRLLPGHLGDLTLLRAPSLPPILRADGTLVVTVHQQVEVLAASGATLWGITTADEVVAVAALTDGRLVTWSRDGQVSVLRDGRYLSLWGVPVSAFGDEARTDFAIMADETAVFAVSQAGGIRRGEVRAFSLDGGQRWSLDLAGEILMMQAHATGESLVLVTREAGGYRWRVLDMAGGLLHEAEASAELLVTPLPNSGWLALSQAQVSTWLPGDSAGSTAALSHPLPGIPRALAADAQGGVYVYTQESLNAFTQDGELRWRVSYPAPTDSRLSAPLLVADAGCVLYTLSVTGLLTAWDAATGQPVAERQLYAGGSRTGRAAGRLLAITPDNTRLYVGAGFLSLFALEPRILAYDALRACPSA